MTLGALLAKFGWTSSWVDNVSGGSGYEAAKNKTNRSTMDLKVQNARQDIDKVTRKELIKKARYLYRNSPIVKGLIERLVTYTIGTGLHPSPMTSSPSFNVAAQAAWRGWAKQPDIESRIPFSVLQSVLFRAMLLDGDIFSLNTYGSSGSPRIQLIESQDICHKNTVLGQPDGVNLDAWGRPISYTWREESILPADDVVHYYLPERAGQKRGLTILHAVINTAHDIDDILALEKESVKDGSSKTDIIKTADGELPSDDYIGVSVQDANTENSLAEITRHYREKFNTEAIVLRKGDEHTPYVSGRPSPAWQGFMDFMAEMICFGSGLPPSLLLGTKVGGADTRREVATAQRVIDSWQQVMVGKLQQVYEYVIAQDITAGFLRDVPKDWRTVEWQTPPKLTVDAGREADADREDVRAGLLTRREYFARWGLDWEEQLEQSAIEAKKLKDLAKKYGVERGEIALLDPNELAKQDNQPNPQKPTVKAKRARNGQFTTTTA